MLFKSIATAAVVASGVAAQGRGDTPICDYYTTALLKNNTAANQMTLLTLVVNTAVIGNYTTPNKLAVPGILAPGMYNGTAVNLLPYFNGGLASTNAGGSVGRAVNFLDDGGAAPLKMNMAANTKTSAQYMLLTHLYEYFGALLGCTMQGGDAYPAYAGKASMYDVHKFMDLSPAEVGYFITQVGMSAASFGVADADVEYVGKALGSLFNYKCAAPMAIIPAQGAQLQSICIQDSCPMAPNATCASYNATMKPAVANSTLAGNSSSSGSSTSMSGSSPTSSMPSSTSSMPASVSKASAATIGMSFAAAAGGLAAMFL